MYSHGLGGVSHVTLCSVTSGTCSGEYVRRRVIHRARVRRLPSTRPKPIAQPSARPSPPAYRAYVGVAVTTSANFTPSAVTGRAVGASGGGGGGVDVGAWRRRRWRRAGRPSFKANKGYFLVPTYFPPPYRNRGGVRPPTTLPRRYPCVRSASAGRRPNPSRARFSYAVASVQL